MTTRALITGITGQDGSYLAEHLLGLGYEVHGIVRPVALEDQERRLGRIRHIRDDVHLHSATLENYASIYQIFSRVSFDECYHLAAQSFVAESFEDGFSTMTTNVQGTQHVLAALHSLRPECRFYFAGSSEMYGKVREAPQSEQTPFHPRSPYAVSKVAGHYLTCNFRESYDLYCCSGILFNHESPRRGRQFVTRKITSAVAEIKHGLADKLHLGNLEARRDWGFAKEYVVAMHLMLQQDRPDDYVVATGETHSVGEFCQRAFAEVGLDYRDFVEVDPRFYRPAEVELLIGDASKAQVRLGWRSETTFDELVAQMVRHDMELVAERRHASAGAAAYRGPDLVTSAPNRASAGS